MSNEIFPQEGVEYRHVEDHDAELYGNVYCFDVKHGWLFNFGSYMEPRWGPSMNPPEWFTQQNLIPLEHRWVCKECGRPR